MMTAKCLAGAFVCLLTLAAMATAQGTGATIQGLVTDAKRAVIPEASVTATNTETNVQRTAITGEAGIYVIPNLRPDDTACKLFDQDSRQACTRASTWL